MKLLVGICSIFALIVAGQSLLLGSTNTAALSTGTVPRVCRIQVGTCNWNAANFVCARQGTTSVCRKFQNRCQFLANVCAKPNTYTLTTLASCANIAVNSVGTCGGAANVASTGGLLSNLFSSNGLGSGTSGVYQNAGAYAKSQTPIVIRV